LNTLKKIQEGDNTIQEIPPTILSLEGETLTQSAIGNKVDNHPEMNDCMFEIENSEFLEKQALSNSTVSGNSCSTEKRNNAKGSNLLMNMNEFPPLTPPTSSPSKIKGPVSFLTPKSSVSQELATHLNLRGLAETDKERCSLNKVPHYPEADGATGRGDPAASVARKTLGIELTRRDSLGPQSGSVSNLSKLNGSTGKRNSISEAQSLQSRSKQRRT
jgi:hypothetical protein